MDGKYKSSRLTKTKKLQLDKGMFAHNSLHYSTNGPCQVEVAIDSTFIESSSTLDDRNTSRSLENDISMEMDSESFELPTFFDSRPHHWEETYIDCGASCPFNMDGTIFKDDLFPISLESVTDNDEMTFDLLLKFAEDFLSRDK
jgi:hypothetical protein